jgi:hypothetical protein
VFDEVKKKYWGIAIGGAAAILLIIGGFLLQKSVSANKKIAAIEIETDKSGMLYEEVASLYDKDQEFLNKETKQSSIKKVKNQLLKKQAEIALLKRENTFKLTFDGAEKNLQELLEKTSLANEKLDIQTEANQLFSSMDSAVEGNHVNDELPITAELTKDKIAIVEKALAKNKQLEGKWKNALGLVVKNAQEQVEQKEKIEQLFNEAFDGNVPKETVQQAQYNTLNQAVEKVKNAELKTNYTAKLILMKAMIDTQGQINALTLQQQAAEAEMDKALEKAKAETEKALNDATSDEKLLEGYSDDQIEFARVWLKVIGSKPSELNVKRIPAGTPINQYDKGSLGYPADAVMLYGSYAAEGQVVYTSNHNGTINLYPVPSHWQMPAEIANNPDKIREMTQKIVNEMKVVSVDVGNPRDVRDVILVEK